MNAQLDYLILGGPLGGLALRPRGGRPLAPGVFNLGQEGAPIDPNYDYELIKLPRAKRRIQVPEWALVHPSVPAGTILWEAFMSLTRIQASQTTNGY